MNKTLYILISFLLFANSFITANNNIDSLKIVLQNSKDIDKCKIYNELAGNYNILENEVCAEYAKKALELAKINSIYDQEAKAYYLLSVLARAKSDYMLSANYAEQSFSIYEKIGYDLEKANSLIILGACKYFMGDYDEALDMYQRALHIYESGNHIFEAANALNNIANVFQNWKNYEKAIDYFTKSGNLYKEINETDGLSAIYNNIANVYFDLGDYNKTIEYNLKSLRIKEQLKDSVGIGISYNNIANVYFKIEDFENALRNYEEALQIFETYNDLNSISMALNNIGFTYESMGDINKALEHYHKGYEIAKKINAAERILFSLESFAEIYKAKGNYKEACNLYRNFIDYKDSIYGEKQQQIITELQVKYETEKKEKEYQLVKKEKEQAELENSKNEQIVKNQNLLIITFVLATIIVLIFLRLLYKQIQKKNFINNELSMKNEEVLQQKEELMTQSDVLAKTNKELEKLSVVARETNNLIIICNKNGDIEWANQAFYNTVNRDFENIKQLNQKVSRKFEDCVNNKKSDTFISSIETFNTQPIWIQTSITLIFDSENNIIQVVAVNSDITYTKNAEEEIKQQQKELVKAFKESSKQQVQLHKAMIQIDEQKKEITDSIHYASRIQNAVLTPFDFFKKYCSDYFIYYQPKDIISGDFFWGKYFEDKKTLAFAVADCTGHGVPGAFMSMLGITTLDEIVDNYYTPASILEELRVRIIKALHQTGKDNEAKDGMDISFCLLNIETNELQFAGANNPLYLVKNKDVIASETKQSEKDYVTNVRNDDNILYELKGDKMPIGIHFGKQKTFTNHTLTLASGDIIYLFSDGYADQFGGTKGKKLKYKKFKELLIENCELPMSAQKTNLEQTFLNWKGDIPQVDDVCILSIKI